MVFIRLVFYFCTKLANLMVEEVMKLRLSYIQLLLDKVFTRREFRFCSYILICYTLTKKQGHHFEWDTKMCGCLEYWL